MADIFPYAYLHRLTDNDFELSIIVDSPFVDITNDLGKQSLRTLTLQVKGEATGQQVDPYYPIKDALGDTIEFKASPLGGTTNDVRTTSYHPSDFTWKKSDLPTNKVYLPHLYFVQHQKLSPKKPYKLYVAVHHARERSYNITTKDVDINKLRHILIEEVEDISITSAGIKYLESNYFALEGAKDAVLVSVMSKDDSVNAKGKGTVRHSSAEIKPFDLDHL